MYKTYHMFSHHYNNIGSQEMIRTEEQLKEKTKFDNITTSFFYEIKLENDDEETFLNQTDY
jgi:hypothetical protein